MKTPDKIYKFHVANLRAISDGLDHVFRSARNAIAREEKSAIETHIRVLSFLLGAWSEVRLMKLLYEPNAFSSSDRDVILKGTALDRWLKVVETAFRCHYGIPSAALRPPKLPSTAHFRLTTLKDTLRVDLRAIVTMRNKLAHGQWIYPLNEAGDDVAKEQMNALRAETVLSLTQKVELVNVLCNVVHDLAVSKATFERDWDDHFRLLEQTRVNIERKSYSKWESQIRSRYQRGLEKLMAERKG